MSADPSGSQAAINLPVWRDPAAWSRTADFVAVLIAVSLPWSTSLVATFIVVWLVAIAPTIEVKTFMQSLRRPVCALPIALFILAVVGILWSDVPWGTRLYYIGPTAKLMVLPLLIYHFERSQRGLRVFIAFLASCTALLMVSWLSYFNPPLVYSMARQIGLPFKVYIIGMPVKNYITQSQEFVLCAFGSAVAAYTLWGVRHRISAIAAAALASAFLANLLIVISSRTAFVCIPVLLLVFMIRHLSRRSFLQFATAAVLSIALAWMVSPYLRWRMGNAVTEYSKYRSENEMTSSGERLEYWRKSVKFFLRSPLIGNGTGSTRSLFEQDAVGKTLVSAEVIANPHNQTLYFAVQWGAIGIALLYAMWTVHFLMFRGEGWAPWLGTMVVVQNIVSSVFNSHLSDFVEGWMYVIGVGVAGGMTIRLWSGGAVAGSPAAAVPGDAGDPESIHDVVLRSQVA